MTPLASQHCRLVSPRGSIIIRIKVLTSQQAPAACDSPQANHRWPRHPTATPPASQHAAYVGPRNRSKVIHLAARAAPFVSPLANHLRPRRQRYCSISWAACVSPHSSRSQVAASRPAPAACVSPPANRSLPRWPFRRQPDCRRTMVTSLPALSAGRAPLAQSRPATWQPALSTMRFAARAAACERPGKWQPTTWCPWADRCTALVGPS